MPPIKLIFLRNIGRLYRFTLLNVSDTPQHHRVPLTRIAANSSTIFAILINDLSKGQLYIARHLIAV